MDNFSVVLLLNTLHVPFFKFFEIPGLIWKILRFWKLPKNRFFGFFLNPVRTSLSATESFKKDKIKEKLERGAGQEYRRVLNVGCSNELQQPAGTYSKGLPKYWGNYFRPRAKRKFEEILKESFPSVIFIYFFINADPNSTTYFRTNLKSHPNPNLDS